MRKVLVSRVCECLCSVRVRRGLKRRDRVPVKVDPGRGQGGRCADGGVRGIVQ